MKKIYLLLSAGFLSISLLAQQPFNWGAILPADYATNPYQRDTIKVMLVDDAIVTDANTLEEVWDSVDADYIKAIDGWSNTSVTEQRNCEATVEKVPVDVPAQAADDFTGNLAVLAGDDALYVIAKVIDNEVDPTGDKMELVIAANAMPMDLGASKLLIPTKNERAFAWKDTAYVWGANVLDSNTVKDMTNYGLWPSQGGQKLDIKFETNTEAFIANGIYPQSGDTLKLAQVTSSTSEACQTFFETTTDGYLFLVVIPWGVTTTKLAKDGDMMSIAPKIVDYDADNFTYVKKCGNAPELVKYDYWCATNKNDAYWAVTFFGAIAKVVEKEVVIVDPPVGIDPSVKEMLNIYVSNNIMYLPSNEVSSVNIYSVTGGLVKTILNPAGNVDLSSLQNGVYVLRARNFNGTVATAKFMKY